MITGHVISNSGVTTFFACFLRFAISLRRAKAASAWDLCTFQITKARTATKSTKKANAIILVASSTSGKLSFLAVKPGQLAHASVRARVVRTYLSL
jgi:hypothetical protein